MATIGPAHIDIAAWGNVKASSAALSRSQADGALTGGNSIVTGGAINNYMTWDVALVAGTWTVTLIYANSTDAGVLTASIDGVDLSPTVDGYNGSLTYDNVTQWTGVSVATGGVKEFKIRSDSKNASSSAYCHYPQLITFTNTDNPTTSFTCTGPSRIDIIPFGYWGMSAGSAPSRQQSSSALNGGYVQQATNIANEIGWYVPLTAGTWAIDVITANSTDGGILTVTAGATTAGTVDTYDGSTTYNNVTTLTGLSVASSAMTLLKFAASTKNGSSSGYATCISAIALRKTA